MIGPSPEIVCVDCGGRCLLLTPEPEDGTWSVGEVVAYRCVDCLDRWDVELTDADRIDGDGPATPPRGAPRPDR